MDIFDGDLIKLLVPVGIALFMWLKNRASKSDPDGTDPSATSQEHDIPRSADYEDIERTRRIQDEIRRKIMERRQGTAPTAEPPPVLTAQISNPPRQAAPVVVNDDNEVLEHQRELENRIRALEAQRREMKRQAEEITEADTGSVARSSTLLTTPTASAIASELKDKAGLRRAWLLREVLSAPVSLR